MSPKVTIIILNWNGWKDTIKCLESLTKITYPNYNLIVVDNGSKDESINKIKDYCEGKIKAKSKFFEYTSSNKPIKIIEYMREEAESAGKESKEITDLLPNKKLILIKNEKNFGYAEGNNIGMRYALKAFNSDYTLILNNDVIVDAKFLDELVKVSESDPKIAISQGKILNLDEKINNTGMLCDIYGSTIGRRTLKNNNVQFCKQHNTFFYPSGACMLVKNEIFKERELFDKILFAYHEDVDLGWQTRLQNYQIAYVSSSICFHKMSSTLKNSPQKSYFIWRNRIRVLIKNYETINLIKRLPIALILEFLTAVTFCIYLKNMSFLGAFFSGIFWNFKHFRGTLNERKHIQSVRKVDDKIIEKYMIPYSLELASIKNYFRYKSKSLKEHN